jgi:hypothetical protein
VRIVDGKWHCRLCGAELDAGLDQHPRTMIVGASGRTNMRALSVGRREIHRCPFDLDVIGGLGNQIPARSHSREAGP